METQMSAQIDSMMFNLRTGLPWHGEGVRVDGLATSEDCIKAAGLDWQVSLRPLYIDGANENEVDEVPGLRATVRMDRNTVLGVVSDKYTPCQNRDAFRFFDGVVGEGKAIYETAGSLDGGKRVWLLAKLPGTFTLLKDDLVEKYLLLSMGHDGGMEICYGFTPVRVVCNNTLTAAVGDSAMKGGKAGNGFFTLRHVGDISGRLAAAGDILGKCLVAADQFEVIAGEMAATKMGDKDAERFMRRVYGREESAAALDARRWKGIDELLQLRDSGKGQDLPGVRGTVWATYNAVTEFEDFHRQVRSTTSRVGRAWFGPGARTKLDAFANAQEFMAAPDEWRKKGDRMTEEAKREAEALLGAAN
jgi:phage/plasmid-like protein (TIGR03299 family)